MENSFDGLTEIEKVKYLHLVRKRYTCQPSRAHNLIKLGLEGNIDRWVSIKTGACVAGLPQSTLYNHIKRGLIITKGTPRTVYLSDMVYYGKERSCQISDS